MAVLLIFSVVRVPLTHDEKIHIQHCCAMKYILLLLIIIMFWSQPFPYLMSNVNTDRAEERKRKYFSSLFFLKCFELHKAVMIIYSPSLLPKMPPTTLPPHVIPQGYTSVLWKEVECLDLDASFYNRKDGTIWKRFWVTGQSFVIVITHILTVFANCHLSALK